MYAEEGQVVQMSCPGNTANVHVRWWKDKASGERDRLVVNGVVIPDFEDYMSFDTTTGILTIYNAYQRDSGVYWCSIGHQTTFEIQLTVFSKPQFSGLFSVFITHE